MIAVHDMGGAGLAVIPVEISVAAAVLALRAREGGEVAAGVDDHGHSLRGSPSVDVGEVSAPSRKKGGVFERHVQRPSSLPASSGVLLLFHRHRELSVRRVVVPRSPERKRVQFRRSSISQVRSWQLSIEWQTRPTRKRDVKLMLWISECRYSSSGGTYQRYGYAKRRNHERHWPEIPPGIVVLLVVASLFSVDFSPYPLQQRAPRCNKGFQDVVVAFFGGGSKRVNIFGMLCVGVTPGASAVAQCDEVIQWCLCVVGSGRG